MFLSIYILGITISLAFHHTAAECIINPFQNRITPVLIGTKQNSNKLAFIYPSFGTNVIRINDQSSIILGCSGQEVVFGEIRAPTAVTATCNPDGRFEIAGRLFMWQEISCSGDPTSEARLSNSNCGNNAKFVDVGFDFGRYGFITTIIICFDTVNERPLYSKYTIPAIINVGDNLRDRPFFFQDPGFFRMNNVDNFYKRVGQRSIINEQLGLPDYSTKFIKDDNRFLSRGHLAAKKDFFYKSAQGATFRFINAAPQWQSFNGENWNQVEIDTRNYANMYGLNLEILTGIYGETTLPHETYCQEVPITLSFHGYAPALLVPAIYWRIVYDSTNRKGIVLLGINNPYKMDNVHIICPDISNQIHWLTWDKFNMEKGYSYACTISSFKHAVQHVIPIPRDIPELEENNLLV